MSINWLFTLKTGHYFVFINWSLLIWWINIINACKKNIILNHRYGTQRKTNSIKNPNHTFRAKPSRIFLSKFMSASPWAEGGSGGTARRGGGCDFISPASFILRNIIQGRRLCQLIPILSPKRKMGVFYFFIVILHCYFRVSKLEVWNEFNSLFFLLYTSKKDMVKGRIAPFLKILFYIPLQIIGSD